MSEKLKDLLASKHRCYKCTWARWVDPERVTCLLPRCLKGLGKTSRRD